MNGLAMVSRCPRQYMQARKWVSGCFVCSTWLPGDGGKSRDLLVARRRGVVSAAVNQFILLLFLLSVSFTLFAWVGRSIGRMLSEGGAQAASGSPRLNFLSLLRSVAHFLSSAALALSHAFPSRSDICTPRQVPFFFLPIAAFFVFLTALPLLQPPQKHTSQSLITPLRALTLSFSLPATSPHAQSLSLSIYPKSLEKQPPKICSPTTIQSSKLRNLLISTSTSSLSPYLALEGFASELPLGLSLPHPCVSTADGAGL